MRSAKGEAKCRPIVRERSGGCCELCGVPAVQMHHRRNRSQGGRWDPSNILHLCVECHVWIGNNVTAAKLMGWTIQGTEMVPAHVPVQLHFGSRDREPQWFLLADDGGLINQEVPFGASDDLTGVEENESKL